MEGKKGKKIDMEQTLKGHQCEGVQRTQGAGCSCPFPLLQLWAGVLGREWISLSAGRGTNHLHSVLLLCLTLAEKSL